MPEKRPHPLGLLAGFVFIVIVVVGFAIGGESPGVDDSAQKVVNFYDDNHDAQIVAILLVGGATVFGAIFVAHLGTLLYGAGAAPAWTALAVAGGIILLVGLLVSASVHWAVTDAADNKYAAETVRGLAALDNNTWVPMGAGMGMFMIGSGAALRGTGLVPGWLAVIAIVIGILQFTPAGFFAFLASGLWIAAASIVLYRSASHSGVAAPPPAPAPAV